MNIFQTITDAFTSTSDLHTDQTELAAIWLPKSIQTATEKTLRIRAGHIVRIENNKLVDCGEPTHVIKKCMGTLSSKFELVLMNLKTFEESKIAI